MNLLPPEIIAMICSNLTLQQYNLLKRSCRYLNEILDAFVTTLRATKSVKWKYLRKFPKLREFYGTIEVKIGDWDILEKLAENLPTLTRGRFLITARLKERLKWMSEILPALYYKKIIDSGLQFQDLTMEFKDLTTWRFSQGDRVRLQSIAYQPLFSKFIAMLVENNYRISFSFKGSLGCFFYTCRNYPNLHQNFERLRLTVSDRNSADWIEYIEDNFLPYYPYCYGMSTNRSIYPNLLKVYSPRQYTESDMKAFPNATFTLVKELGKVTRYTMIMSDTDLLIE